MQNLRSFLRLFVVAVSCVVALSSVRASATAKPTITKLSPVSIAAGGAGFTLTITGTNFISTSKAYWGTTALKAKYVKATELTAAVPATAIAKTGKVNVVVASGTEKSNVFVFTVLPPRPVIASLVPASENAGGPKFTMIVNGKNFTSTSKTNWVAGGKTTALVTAFKTTKELTAQVPASLIAKAEKASVTVTTAGGTSVAKAFVVGSAIPIISSISPTSAIAGSGLITLTVKGYNFTAATAHWNGKTTLATKVVNADELTASVPALLIAAAGTAKVTVSNAKGVSLAAIFTIKPPKPTIASLSPSSATAGGGQFTLTINGANFLAGATVNFGSSKNAALKPAALSATKITVVVPASYIATAGTVNVTVTTTSGTSLPAAFKISPPMPKITGLNPASATAGQSAFTLTITGSGFVSGATVKWFESATSTPLTVLTLTATQITATVPATLVANPGTAQISVTTSAGTSPTASFNVVSAAGPECANDGSGNSKLNGVYSFHLTQVDPTKNGQLNFDIGAFTADGNGGVTAGLQDSNGPHATASTLNTAFTGTYSVGEDDRGLLTLNYTGGGTANFCFALDSISAGVAGSARMVSDPNTSSLISSGAFYAQGSKSISAETVKGGWALGVEGSKIDASNGDDTRNVEAGYVALDGTSSVTAGEADISQDKFTSGTLGNTYKPQVAITGSYTLAATGRGTLALNYSGVGTSNYVFYAAGANQILLLSTDAGGSGGSAVVTGKAMLRPTSIAFSKATLKGDSVFTTRATSNTGSTAYNHRLVQAGVITWNGSGNYTQLYDQNDAGNVSADQSSSSTYLVDSVGRVTINGSTPTIFGYLVNTNQGFAVQGNLGASAIYFEGQSTGGFNLASFSGNYSEGTIGYAFESQKASSGEIDSTGSGSLTGTLDVDPLLNGGVDSEPVRKAGALEQRPHPRVASLSSTYSSASTGRFLIYSGLTPVEALYIVSPDKAYIVDLSGQIWQPLEELNHQ